MEHYNRSEYHYSYREDSSYQGSSHRVDDPSIAMLNDDLAENLAQPPLWSQFHVSQDMYNNDPGEPQQLLPPYLGHASNCHHQWLYDQQSYMMSPALQSPCSRYDAQTIISLAETDHSHAQSPNNIPGDHKHYSSFDGFDGPQNNSAPFTQHGPTETSTTSLSTSRQLATEAVSDAAEKRRVNPHRFFCHYCDRGFTARHNYYRHLGAHNDERPFSCECGSAFTTKSDLKRHKFKSKKHGHGQDYATKFN
ncbi:C2H2-type domain-containing protein [Pleurotus pulmonarius]